MNNNRFLKNLMYLIAPVILLGLALGCVGQPDIKARAWIDYPTDGSRLPVGDTVMITAHIYTKDGAAAYRVNINGESLAQKQTGGTKEEFVEITEAWTPLQAGDYTIEVSSLDDVNVVLSQAAVDLQVIPEDQMVDLTVENLGVIDGDKIRCDYRNLGGDLLPEGRDVWMRIEVGPSESELVEISRSNIGVDNSLEAGIHGNITTAPISPQPEWPQLVRCTIDDENLITESNENNNQIESMISLPDLTVTDVSLVDDNKIRCDYGNLGGITFPEGVDVWMEIYMGDSEESLELISENNIGVDRVFDPGMEGHLTTTLLTPPTDWPQLVLCVIDAGNLLIESDEENNEFQISLGEDLAAAPSATPTSTGEITSTPTPTPTPTPTSTFRPLSSYTPTKTSTEPPTISQTPTATSTIRPTLTTTPTPTETPTPEDTTPPSIEKMQHSTDSITVPPCQPDSVTIRAEVRDASGVQDVKLYYRVVRDEVQGLWQVIPMTNTGNDLYSVTVGPDELRASRDPYGGLILQYYVKAWDTVGNVAETTSGNVQIQNCIR